MKIKNVRFIIAAITTFSAFAVYVSRVNLSIAIIAMVPEQNGHRHNGELNSNANQSSTHQDLLLPQQQQQQQQQTQQLHNEQLGADLLDVRYSSPNSSALSLNDSTLASLNATNLHRQPLSTIFPASKKSVKLPLISQEKFHWDQYEQGHILGAFFYGYILFQIPGARMAESMGAKWIIMAATAGSALISLIFPLSTQLNSIHLLMFLRFVMGLCQSAFFPAAYVLFCRWLPEGERSILLPVMFIGSNMGSVSTYIMSSYLITSSYGWPSVFYSSGFVCAFVAVCWIIFGSNGPSDNWLITERERQFIESNVNNQSSESNSLHNQEIQNPPKVSNSKMSTTITHRPLQSNGASSQKEPLKATLERHLPIGVELQASPPPKSIVPEPSWPKFLKSIPIWTLILSMYGNEWSNVVLCFELPTYLNTALGFPIEQNGVINSFFQLSYTVASPIMSSVGAHMLNNHVCSMRKIHVRRLFQSLATFGQMICFISVPICGANRGLIILFMFSAMVLKSCANAGDLMVAGDLSPEYAGTIFAFANSIGNTAGFFVPLLAGVIVDNPLEREQWTPFWFTTATIMGCSGLIFLIFGETKQQDFDKDPKPTSGDLERLNHVAYPTLPLNSDADRKLMAYQQQQHHRNKLLTGGGDEAVKIHRINTALSI